MKASNLMNRKEECEKPEKTSGGYFEKYFEEGSPFDVKVEDDKEEDVFEINGVSNTCFISFLFM